jgi:hypothetical protein
MKYFFHQVEDIPFENSPVSTEVYFRGAKATGLIEKYLDAERLAVLLFVNGEPGAAYLVGDGNAESISLAEFSALGEENFRAINLPDVAGRLTMLALGSQVKSKFVIANPQDWEKLSDLWRHEHWSGLVEVKSRDVYGFTLFLQGELQATDSIFSTSTGFVSEFPRFASADDPAWHVTTYSHIVSTPAYQCAALRHAAMHWSRGILCRYQEMVGQKMLQMLNRELNRQVQPWQWNIVFDGKDMLDLHFFPYVMDAAHAYRALFMAMGTQMNFVIGSHLTQKLLNETFEQVSPGERVVLQSQRLIPAAFSE